MHGAHQSTGKSASHKFARSAVAKFGVGVGATVGVGRRVGVGTSEGVGLGVAVGGDGVAVTITVTGISRVTSCSTSVTTSRVTSFSTI